MLNKAIIAGRLGRDVDFRTIANGLQIAKFSVATDEKYKNKDGEWKTATEWHNVTAWGKLAELCSQHLEKGSLVYVEGKLKTNQWEKDGQKHYTTEIHADTMRNLVPKYESSPQQQSQQQPAKSKPVQNTDYPPMSDDEEIPF